MDLIERFNLYRHSHPNLSNCWIAYLGLKKKHYDENVTRQCFHVFKLLEEGCADVKHQDIVRLLLYKQSV